MGSAKDALRNAKTLTSIERVLGLYHEQAIQSSSSYSGAVVIGAWNIWFETLHFLTPVAVAMQPDRRFPARYVRMRNAFLACSSSPRRSCGPLSRDAAEVHARPLTDSSTPKPSTATSSPSTHRVWSTVSPRRRASRSKVTCTAGSRATTSPGPSGARSRSGRSSTAMAAETAPPLPSPLSVQRSRPPTIGSSTSPAASPRWRSRTSPRSRSSSGSRGRGPGTLWRPGRQLRA